MAVIAPLVAALPGEALAAPPLLSPHAAVASDHAAASAAGVEVLRAGGNAVDAACATALALGVTIPFASGIGGGGFAMVYLARENKVVALDFRERAPAASKPELYLRDGKPDGTRSARGGLAVAVPGEVRGLAELVRRWGKRPFSTCVAPAERLASRGVPATARVAAEANDAAEEDAALIPRVFTLARPFALPVRAGELLRRPALARTLRRLRREGPTGFYQGHVAQQIVAAVKASGGVMTTGDLLDYRAVERPPLHTVYRGHDVYTMPPPSSGGVVISEALGILAARNSASQGRFSAPYLHTLAEALKHGFADRARHLGDPDFVAVPMDHLTDPAYHRELAARIDDQHVLPDERYGFAGPAHPPRDGGTTNLSVIDAEGNAVALTTTVNLDFGSHVVAGDTGVVLNDQMDDFSLAPDTPNAFGLIGKDKNLIGPGKRPLSSMSPTVVLDQGHVRLAAGGAGGPTIISGTLQLLLNVLDAGQDAQAASSSPRLHHQWSPPTLFLEPSFPKDLVAELEKRGHHTQLREHICTANLVVKTAAGIEAATEQRGGGAPAGY